MTSTNTTSAAQIHSTMTEILRQNFKVPADLINGGATLKDHDLDSLDLVELAEIVEERLGVEVTDEDLAEAGTLDEVVTLISSRSTG